MPDLFEIIESCRAMRRLKPDPVPDELIAKILRAAARRHQGTLPPPGGRGGVSHRPLRRGAGLDRGPLEEIVYQDRWGEPYTAV